MTFWRRRKPTPWYKKMWREWRQAMVTIATLATMAGSAYSYLGVDADPFLDTTEIVAAAAQGKLYVQILAETGLDEKTYVVVNLDGQQVRSLVYPRGIPEGEISMEIPIPFTSPDKHLRVNVEVVVLGLRTLFHPQTLETTINVEVQ